MEVFALILIFMSTIQVYLVWVQTCFYSVVHRQYKNIFTVSTVFNKLYTNNHVYNVPLKIFQFFTFQHFCTHTQYQSSVDTTVTQLNNLNIVVQSLVISLACL